MNAYTLWDEYDTRLTGGRVVSAYDPRRGTYVRRYVQQLGAGVPRVMRGDEQMEPDDSFRSRNRVAMFKRAMRYDNYLAIIDYVKSCEHPPTVHEVSKATGLSTTRVYQAMEGNVLTRIKVGNGAARCGVIGQRYYLRYMMTDPEWRVFVGLRGHEMTSPELARKLGMNSSSVRTLLAAGDGRLWHVAGQRKVPKGALANVWAVLPELVNSDTFEVT